LKTYKAPGLLEGGSEFTVAVATADELAAGLHASRKACRPTVPAPTNRAEPCKNPRRLIEDPKNFGSVPMKDLSSFLKGVTFTLHFPLKVNVGEHRNTMLSRGI
jgi:hypothetical protein